VVTPMRLFAPTVTGTGKRRASRTFSLDPVLASNISSKLIVFV
jgi:hypothetical protein